MRRILALGAVLAASVVVTGVAARAKTPEPYGLRIAREVVKGRSCAVKRNGSVRECNYVFRGVRLTLTMDIDEPQYNVFTVGAVEADRETYLKFGGVHACAIISQYGDGDEAANVFISPKTGDVFTDWRVPECRR